MKSKCPLCCNKESLFYKNLNTNYFKCTKCHAIFMDAFSRPNLQDEKLIYEQHENIVEDLGYQKFVSPITESIAEDFSSISRGLDFGAGTGPVIAKVMGDKGYKVVSYDPFFHNDKSLLNTTYDFISSCEVIEHFHNPHKEFSLLKSLLHKNAKLYCMTEIYDESINFSTWYYKNDPSHVFFYTVETLQWIQKEFGFTDVSVKGRLIIFSN